MGNPPRAKARVLIVDDDEDTSDQLRRRLDGDGYLCHQAASGHEALEAMERDPYDIVVTDVQMPGMSGLELLDRILAAHPRFPVILCTGFGALRAAVDATKRGAFYYLQKPYDVGLLQELMATALLEGTEPSAARSLPLARTRGKASPALIDAPAVPLLLGEAPAMIALQRSIARVATSTAPALILGESGTGKDLVARAIHAQGPRSDRPFVAVNVAAIPEQLLESELFGHVRGAFTGATESRRGLVVEANGGTLFLDEIGDMPIALQAKLLRVLQSGEVRPVGADAVRIVDVRVVAATHRDLPALVASGRFRADLFFRIHVLPITVPPLRDREGDVPMLARHFLRRAQLRTPSSPVRALDVDAERVLARAAWPGNVRELESAMERLVVFGEDDAIHASDLAFVSPQASLAEHDGGAASPSPEVQPRTLREVSERHVASVLASTKGDKRRAAQILGIDLSTLYRWRARALA